MADTFQVVYSSRIKTKLKILHRESVKTGRGDLFLQLLKRVDERLRTEPHLFGESLYTLPSGKGQIRHGIEEFLGAYWAVREEERVVFLKDYRLLGAQS